MCPPPSMIGPRFLMATRRRSTISLTVTATRPDLVPTTSNSDSSGGSGTPTARERETQGIELLLNVSSRPLGVLVSSAFESGIAASTDASGRPQNWLPSATTTTFWRTIETGNAIDTDVPCPGFDEICTAPLICSTAAAAAERPSPSPEKSVCSETVVKPGWNSSGVRSCGMTGRPLS